MLSHLEPMLSTQIAGSRFILATELLENGSHTHHVLQFDNNPKHWHDNQVLELSGHIKPALDHVRECEVLAINLYFQLQRDYLIRQTEDTELGIFLTNY